MHAILKLCLLFGVALLCVSARNSTNTTAPPVTAAPVNATPTAAVCTSYDDAKSVAAGPNCPSAGELFGSMLVLAKKYETTCTNVTTVTVSPTMGTVAPTTATPTATPTPTNTPTAVPTANPNANTTAATPAPTMAPTMATPAPTAVPTMDPTMSPTNSTNVTNSTAAPARRRLLSVDTCDSMATAFEAANAALLKGKDDTVGFEKRADFHIMFAFEDSRGMDLLGDDLKVWLYSKVLNTAIHPVTAAPTTRNARRRGDVTCSYTTAVLDIQRPPSCATRAPTGTPSTGTPTAETPSPTPYATPTPTSFMPTSPPTRTPTTAPPTTAPTTAPPTTAPTTYAPTASTPAPTTSTPAPTPPPTVSPTYVCDNYQAKVTLYGGTDGNTTCFQQHLVDALMDNVHNPFMYNSVTHKVETASTGDLGGIYTPVPDTPAPQEDKKSNTTLVVVIVVILVVAVVVIAAVVVQKKRKSYAQGTTSDRGIGIDL